MPAGFTSYIVQIIPLGRRECKQSCIKDRSVTSYIVQIIPLGRRECKQSCIKDRSECEKGPAVAEPLTFFLLSFQGYLGQYQKEIIKRDVH
jgi:hypothetical protein